MCEYCKNAMTGDDIKDIISTKYDCDILGDIYIDVAILRNNGSPALGASILTAKTSSQTLMPINYCPMCGDKLPT